jgi:hypothetical protein
VFALFTSLLAQAKPPTLLQLAYASKVAYSIEFLDRSTYEQSVGPLGQQGYQLYDFEEDHHKDEQAGFRGVAFVNEEEKNIIIAYRGTDPTNGKNLVVDAGIFLTLAGGKPRGFVLAELLKFAGHYRSMELMGVAAAGATGLKAMARVKLPEAGQQFLAPFQAFALETVFEQLGLAYDPGFPIEAHTRAIVKHADQFYLKTVHSLLAKHGSAVQQLVHRLGVPGEPDLGYRIYITGHSLGGFLAQLVAAQHGCVGITFNAPGAAEYAKQHRLRVRSTEGIVNLFRANDVIGAFGTHLGLEKRLVNFYDVEAEAARLDQRWQKAEAELPERRKALLAEEQAKYPQQLEAYRRAHEDYLKQEAEFAKQMEAFQARHGHRYGATQWVLRKAQGLNPPVSPELPVKPTAEVVYPRVQNPYGPTGQQQAQQAYGMTGYILRNHSLDSIIEQLETETLDAGARADTPSAAIEHKGQEDAAPAGAE